MIDVLALAGLVVSIVSTTHAASNRVPVRVLETKDVEYAYPRWSADGQRILFQSNESGRWQILVINHDGSGAHAVVADSSNNNFPDWSPDGKRIAFVSDRSGNEEIFVADAGGGGIVRLTDDPGRDIHPYWTPDGSGIFFNSTRDDAHAFEVYRMDADGGSLERLTHSVDDETCARLSPTANLLVYLKNNSSGLDDLFLMDLKDRTETNLTHTWTTDGWPCWTPDGKRIIFSAVEDHRYKLFAYDIADKALTRLTDPPAPQYDARANVCADGGKIVFNRQVDGVKNTIGIYTLQLD